jgi:DNA-binding LacI/PurR family transcriptional regulator
VRVPEQLSVVGFDDIPLAEVTVPSLTTVRQPMRQLSQLAVGRLAVR